MKLHEEWKEQLQAAGICFNYTTVNGKYPFDASITFDNGKYIGLRGKRVQDQLYLIPCGSIGYKHYSESELFQFTHLLSFFIAFSKDREFNTILINFMHLQELPQKVISLLVKDHQLTLLTKKDSVFLYEEKLFEKPEAYSIIQLGDAPLHDYLRIGHAFCAFLEKKEKDVNTFSLDRSHFGSNGRIRSNVHLFDSYAYHYLGHSGSVILKINNKDHLCIEDSSLHLSIRTSEEQLGGMLEEYFSNMTKKLKLKQLFSTNTYYYDLLIHKSVLVSYEVNKQIKELLLQQHSILDLEEKSAAFLKAGERIFEDNHSIFSIIRLLDCTFVITNEQVLFHSPNFERAFDYFAEKVITRLEATVELKKQELHKKKVEGLKNPLIS